MHSNTTLTNDSIAKIPAIINAHLLTHYITFTLDDFLSLDLEPQEGTFTLQNQWDSMVNPKINTRIDFQLERSSFIDPDGDSLTFKAFGVPSFLQFSESTLKFYGTPTKSDLGNYSIEIEVSDGYKSIRKNFTFTISNSPPQVIAPQDETFILGDNFDFSLPPNTFTDKDGDTLTYRAVLYNPKDGSEDQLPIWLSLDTVRLRLYGNPGANAIERNETSRKFYQVFFIKMTATDVCDHTASFILGITVQNSFPSLNSQLNLSSQFKSKYGDYIRINEKVDPILSRMRKII